MPARIRRARAADVKPLAKLARDTYVRTFGHSLSQSDLEAHLRKSLSDTCFEKFLNEDIIFVAEESSGDLIGFIQTGRARQEDHDIDIAPGDQELRKVYVLAEHQNNGIGKQLIDAALNEPSLLSARNIYLDVWSDNPRAQALYESYGFKTIGKRMFQVESGAECSFDIIMVRQVVPA